MGRRIPSPFSLVQISQLRPVSMLRPSRAQLIGGFLLLSIILCLLLVRYLHVLAWAR
jgi:hypothetical protein